jgi:hypothetical protein
LGIGTAVFGLADNVALGSAAPTGDEPGRREWPSAALGVGRGVGSGVLAGVRVGVGVWRAVWTGVTDGAGFTGPGASSLRSRYEAAAIASITLAASHQRALLADRGMRARNPSPT